MCKGRFLGVVIVAFLAGVAGAYVLSSAQGNGLLSAESKPVQESVYDRVMRTQTIRCGYIVVDPLVLKDPNTGKLSGIIYDYTEALGQALHLKIDWTEEMGWGDFPSALASNRVDAVCVGIWPNASRARQIDFVRPISYQPVYLYARADDTRFDNNNAGINDPSVRIAVTDGEIAALIAATDFPKAQTVQAPQLTSKAEMLVNIVTQKADVTFMDPTTVAVYEANNPGKIHRIPTKVPPRVFGNTIAIARGQDDFRRMLDTATDELLASGQIEKIIAKYEQFPGTLLRVAPDYRE